MIINSWMEYYDLRKIGPRKEVVESIKYISDNNGIVLDLGCGAFMESIYLLEKGFSVVAVDPEDGLKEIASKINNDSFHFECVKIEDYDFPFDFFDYICANYSLPFISKKATKRVFPKVYNSLRSNGVFSFQLFGVNDERNKWGKSTSFHSEDEIMRLVRPFYLIDLIEDEGDRKLTSGEMNYSHTFKVIVRK